MKVSQDSYAIPNKKEFKPYSRFAYPIQNAKIAGWIGSTMKPPRWIWTEREVSVKKNL